MRVMMPAIPDKPFVVVPLEEGSAFSDNRL